MSKQRLCLGSAQPNVREMSLRVSHCAKGLLGKKLLFLTDIHYGRWFSRTATEQLVRRVNALSPDMVLIGGDLADNMADERDVIDCLAQLRAPMGIACVPGNNDYEAFRGDYAPFRARLEAAGIRLLVNERSLWSVEGGRLILSGLDETKYGHPDAAVLAFARKPGDLHILLTHSPWALDQVMTTPLCDLALCGHTHGGQMSLGGLSIYTLGYEREALRKRRYFFVKGDHEVDGMRILVSNGIGYSLMPIRLNAPPEVHLIELTDGLGGMY